MATPVNRYEHQMNAIDSLGRTKVYVGELMRHPVYTRFLHWMYGIFFFLALLSASAFTRRGSSASSRPFSAAEP